MITLQEQFEKDFPNKSVEFISANNKYKKNNFTNYDLDLREYVNLTHLGCSFNNLTSLDVSKNVNLIYLGCHSNNLTSVDFLNQLPNPEKLEELLVLCNKIQPTDIAIFSPFVNLRVLRIGNSKKGSEVGRKNQFYGSFKSYQNLTKLEIICIEATDVNEGLEYLPFSLARKTAETTEEGSYGNIECSPHGTNAKCSAIQNQLRPFNYDLEAWQLAHPEKMLISRPEYFTNPDSKDKWINALKNKVEESKKELSETDKEKIKKITRLESKISELEKVKETISKQTQTEFQTQNKSTQTDLTMEQINESEKQQKEVQEQIKNQELENEQLKEQIKKLEEENNKTWYQKIIEKYSKK